ncbi:MAG: hypothetical protein CM15mP87_07050 [Candidatus Neomarinimicrobiota bacterium]|nr:MAG: hypothetical protein CM15mP87_07050 [Candidatus Neomarinimicrobiota bacterium]
MDKKFSLSISWQGEVLFSNPKNKLKISLADKKIITTFRVFKKDRVTIFPLYDTEFDHEKRVEIIQKMTVL